ncbi:MAG: YdeI/OmpD-associated family protein [Flavobacteriales bacterium]|nr:YdeI/OmpD-associated family protein [Flavobacteriales bacterium]MBK7941712.1 YdeI/OmpD-associated family protein [Flavobacteriales bacterium]MBK9700254.1 YdeI/OmpD-associated family protein [Flavobacteriales bacterium]
MRRPIRVRSEVLRHRPDLPCHAVIPASAISGWCINGTTIVEVQIDRHGPFRRSLKRWDQDRWFLDLPKTILVQTGLKEGSLITLILRSADTSEPAELRSRLRSDAVARVCWNRLSQARKRTIVEHIRAGRSSSTRERRVASIFRSMGH